MQHPPAAEQPHTGARAFPLTELHLARVLRGAGIAGTLAFSWKQTCSPVLPVLTAFRSPSRVRIGLARAHTGQAAPVRRFGTRRMRLSALMPMHSAAFASETIEQVGVYSCPVVVLHREGDMVSRLPSVGRCS